MNQPNVLFMVIAAGLWCSPSAYSNDSALDEGRVPRFVTSDENPATRDYWASFSPDGQTILFSRTVRQRGKWRLVTVPTQGGESKPLIDRSIPVSATRANWSKSGRIAFTGATRDRQAQLWLVNADGSDPKAVRLPGVSPKVFYPSWYADGNRLVVVDAGKRVLQQVDLKAKKVVALTKPDEFMTGMPSVSPDGKWVAFAGQPNVGQAKYDQTKNTICLVGEKETRTVEKDPKMGRTPAWSPDGRWIAFESNRDSPNGRSYAVFIMDKDGGYLQRLTPYSWGANHPMWSPDGRKMVFSARHPKRPGVAGIAVIDVDPKSLGESAADEPKPNL